MTGRRNDYRIAEIKKEILAAIPEHLLEYGPAGAWLTNTARAMESSPNRLAYYFNSTQHLIYELHHAHANEIFNVVKSPEDWPGTPQDILRGMCTALLAYGQEHHGRHQVYMRQRSHLNTTRQHQLDYLETLQRYTFQAALEAAGYAGGNDQAHELFAQLMHAPLWLPRGPSEKAAEAPIAVSAAWLDRLLAGLERRPPPQQEAAAPAAASATTTPKKPAQPNRKRTAR